MAVRSPLSGFRLVLVSLLCLGSTLPPVAADARPRQQAKATAPLRHPDKIGVGAYPVEGKPVMAADLRRLGARWYYDWGPQGAGTQARNWTLPLPRSAAARRTAELSVATSPDDGGFACIEYRAGQRSLGATAQRLEAGKSSHDITVAIPPTATALRLSLSSAGTTPPSVQQAWMQAGARSRPVALRPMADAEKAGDQPRFVPMIWGAVDATMLLAGRNPAASDTLLTFNEPDHRKQASLTVETALSLWPALMATGRRLSSPAATTSETLGPQSWLGRFMAEAEARHYRVDFIAVHYYPEDPSIPAFRRFLEKVHATYRRPIWITEWALADWKNQSRFSQSEQIDFFRKALRMLDALPFVERHAWFGAYRGLDSWDLGNHLLDNGGKLSPLGEAFREAARSPRWHPDCDPRRAEASQRR